MIPLNRILVRAADMPDYVPDNHVGTVNKRLISPETVGSRHIEMLLGIVGKKGAGGLPHAHPGLEQVCYLLTGSARVECAGHTFDMGPGDCCYFPPDEEHGFTATSDDVKVLVIYAPPFEGRPERVYRKSRASE